MRALAREGPRRTVGRPGEKNERGLLDSVSKQNSAGIQRQYRAKEVLLHLQGSIRGALYFSYTYLTSESPSNSFAPAPVVMIVIRLAAQFLHAEYFMFFWEFQ